MKQVIICIVCSCLLLQNIKSHDSLKSEQANKHRALLARITFSETQSMKVHIMNIKDSSVFVYQKASGKLENQGAGIIIGGILGGGVGTLTGLLICDAYDKKYLINGDWKSFEEMKRSMNY
jgi:hypothetical protein